uniref:Uncharacterized protein n=1 Tax=Tanacetum cinerariifolium TaxID=118510 RepID=A0A6L2LX55_TANCI|nr:hypothetical protein [Tanacetum cinerariifolium]
MGYLHGINDGIKVTLFDVIRNKNHSFDHLFAGTEPNVLADKSKSVSEGLEIVLNKPTTGKEASHIEQQIKEEFNTPPDLSSLDDAKQEIKLEDLSKLVQNMKVDFMNLDSSNDDPIIIIDESEEEEEAKEIHATKNTETEDTLVPQPPSSSSLPTELKDLSSKFNDLTKEVKGLKKHVHELEIKLPGDLKEILTRLENFTLTVSSLTTQVAELKTLQ